MTNNTKTITGKPTMQDFAKCERCISRFFCTVDPRGKRCPGPTESLRK